MKRRLICATLIALVLAALIPAAAFAQPPTILGTLSGSGSPLAGASVKVEQLFKGGLPKKVTTLTTGVDGMWLYTAKVGGMYRLTFSAIGYYTYVTTVEVRTGIPNVIDVDLSPVPPPVGTIQGRITGASGSGLNGYIYFFKQNADGTWPDAYLKVVQTGTGGYYTSGDLPLGAYRVRLFSVMTGWEWYNGVPTPDLATPVVLDTPGQVITGIDAQLP
ncbi:MAG TPA: carboxypeptidase regulatory-like domain-containing protein [Coriobacteriia bacterium]|nr:carboxypeptidase regulatory-like domain-containing protein [Coriobacteriia bacterium]